MYFNQGVLTSFLLVPSFDSYLFYGGGVALSNIEKFHIKRFEGFFEAKKPDWGQLSDTSLSVVKKTTLGPIQLRVSFKSRFSGLHQIREECVIDCWD
jgi:hypothetical protein